MARYRGPRKLLLRLLGVSPTCPHKNTPELGCQRYDGAVLLQHPEFKRRSLEAEKLKSPKPSAQPCAGDDPSHRLGGDRSSCYACTSEEQHQLQHRREGPRFPAGWHRHAGQQVRHPFPRWLPGLACQSASLRASGARQLCCLRKHW